MAQGAETTQTLEASASTFTAGVEGRAVGGQAVEVFYSAVTSKKPAAVAASRRSAITSADATASLVDSGYTSISIDTGNSIHLALSCRFNTAAMNATVFLALYDANNALIGITRDYSFSGGSYTDGTLYVSPVEIVDIGPATKIVPVLSVAPKSGNVSVYVELM